MHNQLDDTLFIQKKRTEAENPCLQETENVFLEKDTRGENICKKMRIKIC